MHIKTERSTVNRDSMPFVTDRCTCNRCGLVCSSDFCHFGSCLGMRIHVRDHTWPVRTSQYEWMQIRSTARYQRFGCCWRCPNLLRKSLYSSTRAIVTKVVRPKQTESIVLHRVSSRVCCDRCTIAVHQFEYSCRLCRFTVSGILCRQLLLCVIRVVCCVSILHQHAVLLTTIGRCTVSVSSWCCVIYFVRLFCFIVIVCLVSLF